MTSSKNKSIINLLAALPASLQQTSSKRGSTASLMCKFPLLNFATFCACVWCAETCPSSETDKIRLGNGMCDDDLNIAACGYDKGEEPCFVLKSHAHQCSL
jgi:hypothetical protein